MAKIAPVSPEERQFIEEMLAYDPESGELRWRKTTANRIYKAGDIAGSVVHGYLRVTLRGRHYQAHRVAWLLHHGDWPKNYIDHLNGDPLDNRIKNLRHTTHRENCRNRRVSARNNTGIAGVCWAPSREKWIVTIHGNPLGYFTDFFEACCVRKSAERLHGYGERVSQKG